MASSWIATCSGFSLEDDIEGEETRSLLSRIHHDHSVEWDGPNHFGNLDDDAQAARVELESALRELDQEDVLRIQDLIDSLPWPGFPTG